MHMSIFCLAMVPVLSRLPFYNIFHRLIFVIYFIKEMIANFFGQLNAIYGPSLSLSVIRRCEFVWVQLSLRMDLLAKTRTMPTAYIYMNLSSRE